MPKKPRPPVHKVPETAFFEERLASAGNKSAYLKIARSLALVICLVLMSSLLYTGVYMKNPPGIVVQAALEANEIIARPDTVLVRRGFTHYSVILLDSCEPDGNSAWFRVTKTGQILSRELYRGELRTIHTVTIALESLGVLVCLAGLWGSRRDIRAFFRGELRRYR